MARAATTANENAANQYSQYENTAANNYNSAMTATDSDIASQEAQGDPYTSKSFLQNQNMLTSAAMNSQDTAAKQQLQGNALRTGTNTASLGATISSNARAGQQAMDQYNAGTANQDEGNYLQYEQGLEGEQQNAANSEEGMYGANVSGESDALNNETNIQDADNQMWGNIIGGVSGAAGGAIGKIYGGSGSGGGGKV